MRYKVVKKIYIFAMLKTLQLKISKWNNHETGCKCRYRRQKFCYGQ